MRLSSVFWHWINMEYAYENRMDGEPSDVPKRADQVQRLEFWRDSKPKKEIKCGKSYSDLPCRDVVEMTTDVCAADTGPEGGIQCLSVKDKEQFNNFYGKRPITTPVAGIANWNLLHHFRAYGLSESLYDFDPVTQTLSGEPNADAFAVVARENNAFLAIADGVNWGEKPFMAARSAVKGCMEYLSDNLHKASTTQEIAKYMLRSFKHAQACIIDNQATLTTLCAAVVCKLQDIDCYGLCMVNVGDSLGYVYRKDGLYVQEVTYGSHEDEPRDLRNAGGCLGPSDGHNPDLTNLTCSFTFVEEGDIVFLTTDGISDNFDPVVLKKTRDEVDQLAGCVETSKSEENLLRTEEQHDLSSAFGKRPRSNSEPPKSLPSSSVTDLPTSADRRNYACALMKQEIESESPCGQESSAKELCANLLKFVINGTFKKREILENGDIKAPLRYQQCKKKPGKLDHATVVAYEIGLFKPEHLKLQTYRKKASSNHDRTSENPQFLQLYGMLK